VRSKCEYRDSVEGVKKEEQETTEILWLLKQVVAITKQRDTFESLCENISAIIERGDPDDDTWIKCLEWSRRYINGEP